jgi:hypothetical protein
MAYMITTGVYFHWVERVAASTNGNGVLKITVHGAEVTNEQHNMGEITIFTEDQSLVDRLVAAINGAAQ